MREIIIMAFLGVLGANLAIFTKVVVTKNFSLILPLIFKKIKEIRVDGNLCRIIHLFQFFGLTTIAFPL
jgi:hypothetical protein